MHVYMRPIGGTLCASFDVNGQAHAVTVATRIYIIYKQFI